MARVVDFRSDTVTQPSELMKHAMVNSPLGDDVYGEDPTVNALEKKIARLLNKENGLFVPSGTMSNLIAIMVHCSKRGTEALVGKKSHIFKYEQGGAAQVGGVLLSTLQNKPDGTFDLVEVEQHIRGSDIHEPVTALIAVENTHNTCGGKVLPLSWLEDLASIAKRYSIPIHMDGARLFNACEYLKEPPSRVVRDCESVTVCFNKGLGAPVGSALVGSYSFIEQARRLRKVLGGGMSQAGVVAAAAIVALDVVVPMLHIDHARAHVLAEAITLNLKNFRYDISEVQTNIVLLTIAPSCSIPAEKVISRLAQVSSTEIQGDCKTEGEGVIVKATYFDDKTIRFALHCDIDDDDVQLAIKKILYVFHELDSASK